MRRPGRRRPARTRRPAPANVDGSARYSSGPVNFAAHSPEDSQRDRRCRSARLARPVPKGLFQVQNGGYASSHDCRVNCSLRSADRRGHRSRSRGVQRLGRATDRRPLPGRKRAGDYAQFAQTCQDSASGIVDACGPGSPDSHRVVWGLTSRPPVSPAGFPPVSRLPAGFSPFARLPLVSLRPAFSGSSPSAVARFQFPFGVPPGSLPLSNLHDSAAAGRFRRRWSRAARAKVTSPAAILQGPACQVPGPPGSRQRPGRRSRRPQASPSRVAHRVSPAVFTTCR